jgi:catechol 2,3-dioxygenase-like lactoylglutathione lyase family enzyme/RimJ/RimL family protein N-acetyltransferase
MSHVREYQASDWLAIWPMLRATFLAGDTYTFSPQSTEEEIHKVWIEVPAKTFVVCDSEGQILGTYFIKPNQPGLGAHVCNCGYVVAAHAQGQGIASLMCEHSQAEALALGFRAMQFNFVVSSNVRAIRLWERLGFSVVGRLPGAFHHQQLGYIDAFVMFKDLAPQPTPGVSAMPKQSLSLTSVLVREYDEAIDFYVKVLGFTLVEDTPIPQQDKRWVVVAPPGAGESRLLLARAVGPEQESRVGNQTGGRVFLFLHTDDFWRDYNSYAARDVGFVRPPSEERYGTVAVFRDLYGNLWDLVQPKEASSGATPNQRSERP